MDKYVIAVGHSRLSKTWKNTSITWDELLERLSKTTRTPESQGEYANMTKGRQDTVKDIGGFVGGKVLGGRRKADGIGKRYILTLDADYADQDFCDYLTMFFEFKWCVYSTHKHTPEKPRLRLIIPLSRPCEPDEYEAVARKIAEEIGIEYFDDTTYQAHRLMYWPSTSQDGEYLYRHEDGGELDVDYVLGQYEDWHNTSSWPTSSRVAESRKRALKKQEDPTGKKGLVGAFCRSYDIHTAIARFLPEAYSACTMPDRYTYTKGSSSAGLVVYEDGKYAYSNHATDPCSGLLCNAFDLVRLHLYGDRDDEAVEGTPVVKLPSYTAMLDLAGRDETVRLTLYHERQQAAQADFAGLAVKDGIEVLDSEDWVLDLAVDSKGRYAQTIDNVKRVLVNDTALRGRIRLNAFTRRYQLLCPVPWDDGVEPREWTDTDAAGLRHYIEKAYEIKGKSILEDAWMLVAAENAYHPVQAYLEDLTWDGVPRVEQLFIDYMGAGDNKYTRQVTLKSLVAAVARIYEPGAKHDTVLTLVGPQGCGKSQIIRRLGKDWFSDSLYTVQGKEAYEQIQGFWIIELGELSALKRSEMEGIKAFTAKCEDSFRAAYGHFVETHKRQCVFFGTTNTYDFLRDATGNRRFWPVDVDPKRAVKDVWTDLTEAEVDQLWAETVQLYQSGTATHIDDDELGRMAEEEQQRHMEISPLAGSIRQYLDKLLPANWEDYDLSARRMYYQGSDFGEQPEGTVLRTKVCPLEVWCELFGGDKKDLTLQKSREIRDIIMQNPEWDYAKSSLRFGGLYGTQRGFTRKSVNSSLQNC